MPIHNASVAVLIPTYQPGSYISRCLESLDKQTLGRSLFTVYIALNGSSQYYTDKLFTLLKSFSFHYELFILSDAGVSGARNFLIDKSKEPYIAFVDDDDYISANYLQNLLESANEGSVIISNSYSVDGNMQQRHDNFLSLCFARLAKCERSKFKTRKYYSAAWAQLIPRGIIGETRFDIALRSGEDSLFMAMISSNVKSTVKARDDTFYVVCERIGSATRSPTKPLREVKIIGYLIIKYFRLLIKHQYDKWFIVSRIIATILRIRFIIR